MADIIALIADDHDWFRRQFFLLDDARTTEELTAIWEPLADRLDLHAEAEETVFYPALLAQGKAGDPEDEAEDAITDHNAIKDAVRAARAEQVGSDAWFEAVGKARTENGEHLDEEEREALPDFAKSASLDMRHELAMAWLRFLHLHQRPSDIEPVDKDADAYLAEHG